MQVTAVPPSDYEEQVDAYIAALTEATNNALKRNPGITSNQLGAILGMSKHETEGALRCVVGIAASVTAHTRKEGRRTVTRWWYLSKVVN